MNFRVGGGVNQCGNFCPPPAKSGEQLSVFRIFSTPAKDKCYAYIKEEQAEMSNPEVLPNLVAHSCPCGFNKCLSDLLGPCVWSTFHCITVLSVSIASLANLWPFLWLACHCPSGATISTLDTWIFINWAVLESVFWRQPTAGACIGGF